MLRWRELADAMTEVEDVRRASDRVVGMRHAEAVQHLHDLRFDLLWRCEKHVRIDVALKRFGAFAFTYRGARVAKIHCPVEAEHFAIERTHRVQPQPTALGEHDAR